MTKISNKDLKRRADFFCKTYFDLPFPYDARFATEEDEDYYEIVLTGDDILGLFEGNGYGTGSRWLPDEKANWDGEEEAVILINPSLSTRPLDLNNTLIHELCHYVLWFRGGDCEDGEPEFETLLHKMGAVGHYDKYWDKNRKCWKRNINKERMQEYEDAYQAYKASLKKARLAGKEAHGKEKDKENISKRSGEEAKAAERL